MSKGIKVSVMRLQLGMCIQLPLKWHRHPFMFSSFKLREQEQVDLIRKLGLKELIYFPDRSDSNPLAEDDRESIAHPNSNLAGHAQKLLRQKQQRIERQKQYTRVFQRCEQAFLNSVKHTRTLMTEIGSRPLQAVAEAESLVRNIAESLMQHDNVLLHLMNDGKSSDNLYYHTLNVAFLGMLLGREKQLSLEEIQLLGMAGLFHDIGKTKLPSQILRKETLNQAELNFLKLHPKYGLDLLKHADNFPERVKPLIMQHHEHMDGSGYPAGLSGNQIDPLAAILALVDEYDSLCHPLNPKNTITPYQALAVLFKQKSGQFVRSDIELLVKMLGIYPPGSIVKLSSGEYGLVVAVNQTQILYPEVMLYDPEIPRSEAPMVDLHQEQRSIAKVLTVNQLPQEVREYLNPRTRISYFMDTSKPASP